MIYPVDEGAKRRLTDRSEVEVAVEFLQSNGVPADEIAVQLARFYYVDLDEVAEVVASTAGLGAGRALRHVA